MSDCCSLIKEQIFRVLEGTTFYCCFLHSNGSTNQWEELRHYQGRYNSLDMCNYCLSPRLAAFPLFSKIIDKKHVQSVLPEFIYCTLLNFPLLRSLNKESLHSKPLLVCHSNTLTFSSSAVIEGYFLSSKGSYGISVIALHITGNNPGSPCLSSLHAGLVWGGLVALFPRV